MTPTTKKTIWRGRKEKKTQSLFDRKIQLQHFRRSTLAKDTIKRIILQTKLARRRYSGRFGDRTWGQTKTSFATAEKRLKVARRRCRRRDKAFKAVLGQIFKARSETARGTKAPNIAHLARRKQVRAIASKLQFSATMDPEAMPTNRADVSASLPKRLTEVRMLQTAETDHPSRKRRKITGPSSRQIHLDHHEDFFESSPGVAQIPRRDKSHPTTSLQTTEELLKLMGKRKDRSNEKEGLQRYTSLRSSTSHTGGSVTPGLPNKTKTQNPPESMSDRHQGSKRDGEKKGPDVNIPAATKMATDLRPYSQWPDDSGTLVTAQGCLLPAMYQFSNLPGFEWICPVRTCRQCYKTQKDLGSHFSSMHHSCLLNDNCDGTFTIVKKRQRGGNRNQRPPLVKTKNALPEDAPPPVVAWPSVTYVTLHQQETFAAIKKSAQMGTTPKSREEKTVDELMLVSSFPVHPSAEASKRSELGDASHAPPCLGVEEGASKSHASSGHGLNRPPEEESSEERNRPHTSVHDEVKTGKEPFVLSDAKQENWSLVGKFLDGRQVLAPKRGHFATLLSSPRIRNIVTRAGENFIADQPKKVRLLIVHMTGKEPSVPCNSCALGRGPLEKCVSISKKAAGETTNGVVCCTNCASNRIMQLGCNVEELLSQPPAAQMSSPNKEHKKRKDPEPREQTSSGVSSQITKVDSHYTLAVHKLVMDGSLDLDAAPSGVRLCSLTTGKVLVELEGNSPFLMGAHGMFKVMPTIGARISNATETEAILHVSTVKS